MKLYIHTKDAELFPINVGKMLVEYRKKLKRSQRGVQIFDAYDPADHPHAPKGAPAGKGGQFVSKGSGGGGSTESKSKPEPETKSESKSEHHPDLVNVGGDEWNKKTAKRLADEFQQAKPELDKIKTQSVSSGIMAEEDEDPDENEKSRWRYTGSKKWNELSKDTKKAVESDWMETHWEDIEKDALASFKKDRPGEDIGPNDIEELTLSTLQAVWAKMEMYDKYDYASDHNEEVIKIEEKERQKNLSEPTHYDPLNEPTDDLDGDEFEQASKNYKKTQALARKMSVDRAVDLILQKNLVRTESWDDDNYKKLRNHVADIDTQLWSSWKSSSTSQEGYLIQAAAADELGGRARGLDMDQWKKFANLNYRALGGWDGIKAMMRAKWETSQYLLEKAGINKVEVYRGLDFEDADNQPRRRVQTDYSGPVASREQVNPEKEYALLSDVDIKRNGAASTSLSYSVSNGWDGDAHRVVLRISAPRTAVLSLPAYGMNETSEREVVLVGTAWNSWDAWAGKAAPIEAVPIGEAEGDEMELPAMTILKRDLTDKGFDIYTATDEDNEETKTIQGSYLKPYEEDKAYVKFVWNPQTKSGTVTVQPDFHEDDYTKTEIKGSPGNVVEAVEQALGEAHGERMPNSAIKNALDKAFYEENDVRDGLIEYVNYTDDDESKIVVSSKITTEGEKVGGGTAWWHYKLHGGLIEKGDNINDLWKHLEITSSGEKIPLHKDPDISSALKGISAKKTQSTETSNIYKLPGGVLMVANKLHPNSPDPDKYVWVYHPDDSDDMMRGAGIEELKQKVLHEQLQEAA